MSDLPGFASFGSLTVTYRRPARGYQDSPTIQDLARSDSVIWPGTPVCGGLWPNMAGHGVE